MTVTVTTVDVVRLGPHLDVRTVAEARSALYASCGAGGPEVVVDMSGVESIDAAGLGMLTAVHLRCERAGRRLVLRDCQREIRRVLAVTRLNRILHVDRSSLALPA